MRLPEPIPGDAPPPAPSSTATALARYGAAAHGLALIGAFVGEYVAVSEDVNRHVRLTSWPMLTLLVLAPLIIASQGLFGSMATRRHGWPSWLPLLGPALILQLGLGAVALALQQPPTYAASWSGRSGKDLAQEFLYILNISTFAAVCAAVAASCAATMLAARALSHVREPAFGRPAIIGTAVAVVGLVGVALLTALWPALTIWLPFGLLAAVSGGATVAIGGYALGSKCADDDQARGRAAADLLAAALASAAAVGLVTMWGRTTAVLDGFGHLTAMTFEPATLIVRFSSPWNGSTAALWPSLVYALPALLGTAAVLMACGRRARRVVAQGWGSLLAGLLVAATVALPELQIRNLAERVASGYSNEPPPADLSLVRAPRHDIHFWRARNPLFVGRMRIRAFGAEIGSPDMLDDDAGCDAVLSRYASLGPTRHPDYSGAYAVDAATPFHRVACLARAQSRANVAAKIREDYQHQTLWIVQVMPTPDFELAPPFDTILPLHMTVIATSQLDEYLQENFDEYYVQVALTRTSVRFTRRGRATAMSGSVAEQLRWLDERIAERDRIAIRAEPDVSAQAVVGVMVLSEQFPYVIAEP